MVLKRIYMEETGKPLKRGESISPVYCITKEKHGKVIKVYKQTKGHRHSKIDRTYNVENVITHREEKKEGIVYFADDETLNAKAKKRAESGILECLVERAEKEIYNLSDNLVLIIDEKSIKVSIKTSPISDFGHKIIYNGSGRIYVARDVTPTLKYR